MDMVPPNLLMELNKFSCHFRDVRIVPGFIYASRSPFPVSVASPVQTSGTKGNK